MSRYSSDSNDEDYKGKSSHRKRQRSESISSRDSYIKSKRRSRKSRSHSRDRSKNSYRDKRNSNKDRGRSHRSRSRRRYRSISRSRSRSRTSSISYKKKSYSRSKRKYKSRSRSRSYHRKSRSHSRRRSRSKQRSYHRSKSRSSSSSKKRSSPNRNGNDSSSSEDSTRADRKPTELQREFDSKQVIKLDVLSESSYLTVTIPSDDPIVKQEQLDDINAPSFKQKTFKSSKISNHEQNSNGRKSGLEQKITSEREFSGNNHEIGPSNFVEDGDDAKRRNETVFDDSIAFEDNEIKIQKWVKKLFTVRQKFLYGYPNWDK